MLFALGVGQRADATLTNLFNLISGRDAFHPCFISTWPKEGCTIVCVITHYGTPFLRPSAYKLRVGGVSPWCGIEQIRVGSIGLFGPFPKWTNLLRERFVENVIFFGGKYSCLIFYDGIKMFVASKVLFMTTEEKPLELLTFVMALVHWKYKIYIFFYGVSICDKQSSIVNIKEGIIYDDGRNTVGTINTCNGLCASKIQNIYFLWCYYLRQTLFYRKFKKKKMVLATDMKPLKMVKYFGGKIPSFLFTFVKTFSHRN